MKIFRLIIRAAGSLWRDQDGVAATEFMIALPVLILILVMSTDYALSVLAKNQVEAAADAAAQYLLVNGWDGTSSGRQAIANAGTTAFSNLPASYASPAVAQLSIDPTNDIVFECATTNSGTYARAGNYSTTTACAAGGYPFGSITARGRYQPFFPAWWSGLTNGALNLTATVTTRFQ